MPDHPEGPVNDYANVLPPGGAQRLQQQLLSYEQGTTRQIAVAIFPSLEEESLEDFTIRLAEKWKVGGKKNSDGVLVTLFIKEHRDRIDVGYGLEDKLTDALSARINGELMEPRFKAGDYEGGLRQGLSAIDTATGGHAHAEGQLAARRPTSGSDTQLPFFLIVAVILIISWLVNRGRGGRGGGFWGGGGGWFMGGGGGWSSGGSGGGGGGWSGGGGSFGGGGSSGSW